jgi:hypothetical protein
VKRTSNASNRPLGVFIGVLRSIPAISYRPTSTKEKEVSKIYLDIESGTFFHDKPLVIETADWTQEDWAAWDNMSDHQRGAWGEEYAISLEPHPGQKPLFPAEYAKILEG